MPLYDGDPADPYDVWTRVLTADYWRADGTLHNGAFSGKHVITSASEGRPWSHELSGSLLSLVDNLRRESEEFCAKLGKQFHGIMYQTVENLRTDGTGYPKQSPFPTDVRYTPLNGKTAHADLVTFKTGQEDRKEIRDWLQEMIQAVRSEKLPAVCSMRLAPHFPSRSEPAQ